MIFTRIINSPISLLIILTIVGIVFNQTSFPLTTIHNEKRWLYPLIIILVGIFIGFIFKLQHYPGGSQILIICLSSLSCYFMLRFSLKKKKTLLSYLKYGWGIIFPIGYLFKLMHWPNGGEYITISTIFFFAFIMVWLYQGVIAKPK